ncbi:hypothetical protein AVEN_165776-1, partial [Araneus ventricosus]
MEPQFCSVPTMGSALFFPNKTRLHAENSAAHSRQPKCLNFSQSLCCQISLGAVKPPDLQV